MKTLFGGIEAGGTKFVCAVGTSPEEIIAETRFPTTSPENTFASALDFFKDLQPEKEIAALGIASFGPVDLDPNSETYGFITTTPKPGWSNVDFAKKFEKELKIPVGFDTDVNGALLAEHRWGAAKALSDAVYLTIGTGIGGGVLANGKLIHGMVHPEMGHVILPVRKDDGYLGGCPYHGNCFEGLANGPAIRKRWGLDPELLPADHPSWELEAHYIAAALHGFICTLSPEKIILGGGVMNQGHLYPLIREMTQESLKRYITHPAILDDIDNYIVPPALGNKSGVLGAIAIAQDAINNLPK